VQIGEKLSYNFNINLIILELARIFLLRNLFDLEDLAEGLEGSYYPLYLLSPFFLLVSFAYAQFSQA